MTVCVFFFMMLTLSTQSNESGTLLVLNKSDNTVSLIDLQTRQAVATIPTGFGPHEVAVSADGLIAVIGNYGASTRPGNSLSVIDIREKRKIRDIDLRSFQRPHGIEWTTSASIVCVTVEGNRSLLLVDIQSGEIITSIATEQDVSHMVALTLNSARAFVANIGSGTVTVIDLQEKKKVSDIATGAGAEGICITPDGKEIWVTNRAANTVSIIEAKTLSVVSTLESKDFPIRAKITPNGAFALISNARSGDISVFDVKKRVEVRRIPMGFSAVNDVDTRLFGDRFGTSPVPIGILISPDGHYAYVANSNADLVTVIDLREWKIIGRIATGKEPDGLGFSPITLSR
jgi:YVTN family beta-propeller protein